MTGGPGCTCPLSPRYMAFHREIQKEIQNTQQDRRARHGHI